MMVGGNRFGGYKLLVISIRVIHISSLNEKIPSYSPGSDELGAIFFEN